MIYVIGPGHGGPGLVAHSYLEGSYTERYPNIERSRNGLQRLFRQFSWPYGIPSHVAPETRGSIHEGGELGYSLVHAYGAAFDNPDLIVACIIGDGEAETGALATSWHSNKFLNPSRDGAVLPILHLNGFKIANPTVLARISDQELTDLIRGYGYEPHFVEGDVPAVVHQLLAGTFDTVVAAEFGLVEAQGLHKVARLIAIVMDEIDARVPDVARRVLKVIVSQIEDIQTRIAGLETQVLAWHKSNPVSQRLATIPGVGPIIATAIAATVANLNIFRSGREFAAWLGLMPRQNSTGGKARLGGISKRGESYLRRLLVNSAHTVLLCSKAAKADPWLISLLNRKPRLVVAVALANKTARIAWAIMSRPDLYRHAAAAA